MKNRFNLISLFVFALLTIMPLFGSDGVIFASGEDAAGQLSALLKDPEFIQIIKGMNFQDGQEYDQQSAQPLPQKPEN